MGDRLAIATAIAALTIVGFFEFPGHTFLGSDTQIYIPMLEHIWDPSSLSNDLVAAKPHLAYTLYDEIAIALRWLTHSSFQTVLVAQQLVFRALQILGVYLLAVTFPLRRSMAMLVAAFFALGAAVAGPAVLTFEYEPVPRGFAIALVFLAIGLAANNHLLAADIVAAVAFLYHPPTVWVFWAVYLWLVLRHRDYYDLWPLGVGLLLLFVSSRFQAGAPEPQLFLSRVSPELEKLQRMRASYNWVSTWRADLIWQYIVLYLVSLVAFWRVRPQAARWFLIGMPALGILSMPLSYLLLEKLKWELIPQFQPMRAVLFITAFALILGAAAGIRAVERRHWLEAIAWFAFVLAIPSSPRLFAHFTGIRIGWTLGMALAFTGALYLQRFRWAPWVIAAVAIAPFFVIPNLEHVRNDSNYQSAGADDLTRFAQAATPKDAVFLFGDAGMEPYPAVFRAQGNRAVYVDWKSGGQINFSASLAREWWQRWQSVNGLRFDVSEAGHLAGLGIDYLVLERPNRWPGQNPVYENGEFVVYKLTGH